MSGSDELQLDQLQGEKVVGMYMPTLENKSLDPTLTYQMISVIIKQNNLPQDFNDKLNIAYLNSIISEIKTHIGNPDNKQKTEIHADEYCSSLKGLLENSNKIEGKYNKKQSSLNVILEAPQSNRAKVLSKELVEEYKDREVFKSTFIEANMESQQLKYEKIKLKDHHEVLMKEIGSDDSNKKILVAKLNNAAEYVEQRSVNIDKNLKSDLVGFLKYQEIKLENNKDVTKEAEQLDEKYINKLSSYYKQQQKGDPLTEKTESLQKHPRIEDKFFDELKKASNKEQKEIVFEKMMTMHKNIIEGKSFVEKLNVGSNPRSLT